MDIYVGRVAHWVKHLPHKHKDLSTVPRTYTKIQVRQYMSIILALGKQREADPWGSLARQSSPTNELQVH